MATTMKILTCGLVLIAALGATVSAAPAQAAPPNVNQCFNDWRQQGPNGLVQLHPPGWPCGSFTNRRRVIQRVKQLLLYNGYRQAGMYESPALSRAKRWIVMRGCRTAYVMRVTVVKTKSRQIAVTASDATDYCSSCGHTFVRVNLGFVA